VEEEEADLEFEEEFEGAPVHVLEDEVDAPLVQGSGFRVDDSVPPWRHPRGKWMVPLVNSHANATSRWHLWEIDSRFALNSTPGWLMG